MIKALIERFKKDESGATAIEYGLIAGLISVLIIGAVTVAGGGIVDTFWEIAEAFGGARPVE